MRELPVPPEIDAFLSRPNPAVIASVKPDGTLHTVATWYLWDDGRVLVNTQRGRPRFEYLRSDPRVSLTVLGSDDWYHHVSLQGVVASIDEDPSLSDIDRLALHYLGQPYPQRDSGRDSAWIDVQSWHAWAVSEPWAPGAA
jgi:PPOX class probable F420-dependent enzyme